MGNSALKPKGKEIRHKAEFSLPCPECGAECRPDTVTKPQQRKVTAASGAAVVLPQHYLDLRCQQCGLPLWVALADGKPLDIP